MTYELTLQELGELQARIAAAPKEEQEVLLKQLETLMHALRCKAETQERQHDAEVEAIFDNMPV